MTKNNITVCSLQEKNGKEVADRIVTGSCLSNITEPARASGVGLSSEVKSGVNQGKFQL